MACTQLDVQSAVTTATTTPDLSLVDQSVFDFDLPLYSGYRYDSSACRYAHGVDPWCYETSGAPTTTATAASATRYAEFMPCNMQQRLVCGGGGGVVQYRSLDGAVYNALQYDAAQQRAVSDLSGNSRLSIGELPKLCEKISILMQANVLIADWYVAPLFPHI